MNCFNKTVFVVLLLICSIISSSCSASTTKQTAYIPTNDVITSLSSEDNSSQLYEFSRFDTQNYIHISRDFFDCNLTEAEQADLVFDSIESFVDSVTNYKLEKWQLKVINDSFASDENGIKICDFSNLYVPITPKGFINCGVSWSGEQYTFFLNGSNNEIAFVEMCTPKFFEDEFIKEYEGFFSKKNISLTASVENENQTEYFYTTTKGSMKKIRFSFVDESRQYIVDETYRLSFDNQNIKVSSTIPYKTVIYISDSEDQSYTIVTLFDYYEKDYSLFKTVSYIT